MSAKYEMPGHQGLVEVETVEKEPTYYPLSAAYTAKKMAQMVEDFPNDPELLQLTETMQQLRPDVLVPCMFGLAQIEDGTEGPFFFPSQLNGNGPITD